MVSPQIGYSYFDYQLTGIRIRIGIERTTATNTTTFDSFDDHFAGRPPPASFSLQCLDWRAFRLNEFKLTDTLCEFIEKSVCM